MEGGDELGYDFSGVRLAAVKALLYAPERARKYVEEHPVWGANQDLRQVVDAWLAYDSTTLESKIRARTNDLAITVAAIALGLMNAHPAFPALAERFEAAGDQAPAEEVRWALCDSMLQFCGNDLADRLKTWVARPDLAPWVVYMIGRRGVPPTGQPEWDLLHNSLLAVDDDGLRGRALMALAELGDESVLATAHEWLNDVSAKLCYYSLQTLRQIGDATSLRRLEDLRWQPGRQPIGEFCFLQQVRLEVYEDIYWRLAGGLSRELMKPIAPGTQTRRAQP